MNEKFAVTPTLITPEVASEMLTHNTKNRPLHEIVAKRYADEMKQGKWRLNSGQPIVFASDGTLIDGQHRLQAVIKAAIPIEMAVYRGADKNDFVVIDTGVRRTTRDILALADTPNSHNVSSIMRYYWSLKKERTAGKTTVGSASFGYTNEDALNEYVSSPELYQSIAKFSVHIYNKGRYITTQEVGGICVYLVKDKHHDIEQVRAFFEELATGGEYPAISYTRTRLVRSSVAKNTREKLEPQGRRVLLAKAWNLFLQGNTEQKIVLYRMGEKAIFD